MPKKTVIASSKGNIFARRQIVLNGLNYVPANSEFISLAKKLLKDDGHNDDQINNAIFDVLE